MFRGWEKNNKDTVERHKITNKSRMDSWRAQRQAGTGMVDWASEKEKWTVLSRWCVAVKYNLI